MKDKIYYSDGMERASLKDGNCYTVASQYGKMVAEQNRQPQPHVKPISIVPPRGKK